MVNFFLWYWKQIFLKFFFFFCNSQGLSFVSVFSLHTSPIRQGDGGLSVFPSDEPRGVSRCPRRRRRCVVTPAAIAARARATAAVCALLRSPNCPLRGRSPLHVNEGMLSARLNPPRRFPTAPGIKPTLSWPLRHWVLWPRPRLSNSYLLHPALTP